MSTRGVVQLRTRDGREAVAEARVRPWSPAARVAGAVAVVALGLLLGAASIPVPLLHLIAPWAVPLVAGVVAWWVSGLHGHVGELSFTCPACDASASVPGGLLDPPIWRRCPHCAVPLEVTVAPDGGQPPTNQPA